MQNVPKIVQARLQREALKAAESHPDADLLTAFAEQSLDESERDHVMEHLARCHDCREIVALSLPATEAVTVSRSTSGSRTAWLSWPVLRWGVVAAGIALVTSVGILRYSHRTEQNAALVGSTVRQEEKVATVTVTVEDQASAPTAQASLPQAAELAKQTPRRKLSRSQAAGTADQPSPSLNLIFPPSQSTGSGTGGGVGGGVFRAGGHGSGAGQAPKNNPEQLHGDGLAFAAAPREEMPGGSQSSAGQPVPAAPQVAGRSTSQMVDVQSESAQVATQGQAQGQLAQNQIELPSQKQPLNNLDVVKAKDSVPPQTQSVVVFAPTVSTANISLQKELSASLRWSISSTGALQRSFDSGATWEDVNVNQTPLASSARMARASDSKDQFEAKTIKKKEQPDPVVVFRAVAAFGAEVWAGGSRAMLYHSADSGMHWTRVVPSQANASLAGDIVGVEFSDTNHGKIATSAGEVWMTGDDGQTWHKQ